MISFFSAVSRSEHYFFSSSALSKYFCVCSSVRSSFSSSSRMSSSCLTVSSKLIYQNWCGNNDLAMQV